MRFTKALALVATTAVLAACGGGDTEDRLDARDPVVRVLQVAPAGPNVSLFRDDVAITSAANVPYKSTTAYADVSNANATWSLRAAGGTTALASATVDPDQGNRYTFAALPGATPGAVDMLVIDDPYNKSLTSNDARIRVLHAAGASPAVDVYVMQPAADLATTAPTISGLAFRSVSPASTQDSLEVDGGSYRIVLTLAGTKTVVFNAPVVSIADNVDWLVTAVPGPSGLPADVRLLIVQGNGSADGTVTELTTTP